MLRYIPPSHESMVHQAFYTAGACLLVALLAVACTTTYQMMQPFMSALVWALLLGSVMFPAKRRLTVLADHWLAQQRSSGPPLLLALALAPLSALDAVVTALGDAVLRRARVLVLAAVVLIALNVMYVYTPRSLLLPLWFVKDALIGNLLLFLANIFHNKLLCWACIVAYILSVVFLWYPPVTCRFAVPVWLLLLALLSGLAGSLSGPIFICLVVMLTLGLITEIRQRQQASRSDAGLFATFRQMMRGGGLPGHQANDSGEIEAIARDVHDDLRADPQEQQQHSELEEQSPSQSRQQEEEQKQAVAAAIATSLQKSDSVWSSSDHSDRDTDTTGRDIIGVGSATSDVSGVDTSGCGVTGMESATSDVIGVESAGCDVTKVDGGRHGVSSSPSSRYIVHLFYVCLLVLVWRNIWLLSTLPLLVIYYMVRQLAVNFWISRGRDILFSTMQSLSEWVEVRREALMPLPICGMWKLLVRGNSSLVQCLRDSIDGVITALVVVSGIVFVLVVTILASVQIYRETVHMVELSADVLNSTVVSNSQIHSLLPNNTKFLLEQMLNNGYEFGRTYISKTVRSLVADSSSETVLSLEQVTLELWDRLYLASVSSVVPQPVVGPVLSGDSVISAGQDWIQSVMSSTNILNFQTIQDAIRSNLDVVMSVLDSFSVIVRSNVSLMLTLVTYSTSLLLGGGFVVLNTLINLVVFLTALFYLLSSSDRLYKPIELFSKFNPLQRGGDRFMVAVDEAISDVFVASLKMAMFYFLWTWLVHSVFCVNFVYLPSVLAAVFATVPFLGSYWAALPAVLELWLVHEEPYLPLAFICFQISPVMFVDSAIYSEVKGCHPYLTGLSIAGGIFYLGIEGAFAGPLLLCCLLVAVRMCSDMTGSAGSSWHRRFSLFNRNASLS